jgi:hypothetical protein
MHEFTILETCSKRYPSARFTRRRCLSFRDLILNTYTHTHNTAHVKDLPITTGVFFHLSRSGNRPAYISQLSSRRQRFTNPARTHSRSFHDERVVWWRRSNAIRHLDVKYRLDICRSSLRDVGTTFAVSSEFLTNIDLDAASSASKCRYG